MAQMKTNRPVLHREEETWEAVRFMDEAGREIIPMASDLPHVGIDHVDAGMQGMVQFR